MHNPMAWIPCTAETPAGEQVGGGTELLQIDALCDDLAATGANVRMQVSVHTSRSKPEAEVLAGLIAARMGPCSPICCRHYEGTSWFEIADIRCKTTVNVFFNPVETDQKEAAAVAPATA